MSSTTSFLAGLVKGFTEEKSRVAHEELAQRASQQSNMLQYLSHLASNPNVPPEHQQWALGKIQELAQADPTKKLPKVDMSELPAVNVPAGPTRSTTPPPVPSMTLTPPVGPGANVNSSDTTWMNKSIIPSGDIGRASDTTVNALGNITPPVGPSSVPGYSGAMPIAGVRTGDAGPAEVPNSLVGLPDAKGNPTLVPNAPRFDLAPPQPVTLPAHQQATVTNPTPPIPISPAGQIHLLTAEDRAKYPQPPTHDKFTLTPGEKRYEDGKVIAENKEVKPGTKSGYEPKMGPGGPIGVTDVATGGMLTPEQVAANPQAKAVLDQATAEYQRQQDAQDERDQKKFENAQVLADKADERAAHRIKMGQANQAAQKAKPMVDLLDTSEDYFKSGDFSPRKDLSLIVAAVRAMNPGTVRLPQKELELELHAGSYGDRFRRWFDKASEGTLPDDQRSDLMRVIRDETTHVARSSAEDWRDAFKGTKEEEPPTYLRRFETRASGAQGTGPGQFTVTDPEGGVHTFPDQASADRFKAAIGGK